MLHCKSFHVHRAPKKNRLKTYGVTSSNSDLVFFSPQKECKQAPVLQYPERSQQF